MKRLTQSTEVARPAEPGSRCRGVLAVLRHLLGALDALLSAVAGIPRLGWLGRRAAREIASQYRLGKAGAIDAEVVEDR